MSRAFLALLLTTAALAGCASAPADPTADGPEDQVLPEGVRLHRPDGSLVELPEGSVLPVGTGVATGFGSFEPTIGVTSDGFLFMSNSEGSPVTDHSSIVRSTDGGATWHDITPMIGPASTPPTTFDPYIHVDQDTDRIYNLDMEGLNCNYIQWSDDGGESFTGHPLGCGQPPVLDHPSLFTGKPRTVTTVGYDNIVYLCVNRVADSACAVSLDGGLVFSPFRPVFPEVGGDGAPQAGCGGLAAHGTTGPEGRAYLGKGHCGVPMVAVTEDDGLTWTTTAVSNEYAAGGHDVEVAVDEAGNVYALWRDEDWDLRLSVSQDHGRTWGPDHLASPPGVNMSVFPAIAAGADGRIAFTYYGTPHEMAQGDLDERHAWTAYLTTVVNATAEAPVFATAPLSDHPIARGPCDDDNRCSGVGDFVDIVIDQEGRPWAGLFDSCPGSGADTCDGAGTGFLGTLRQGPALRGASGPLPVLTAF